MAFFEESRQSDFPIKQVIDSLYLFFPDINEEDINFFYHGTYNVFEVKNQFIFRFPDKYFRNTKGVKLIQNEVKILYFLQKYISVDIPEPIYISFDPNCPFMGYEKIEGIPLSLCFHKASKDEKNKIAKEISKFLSELHSDKLLQDIRSNRVIDDSFSCEKFREEWQNYFKKIQNTLFNLMNSVQKKWIVNLFNSFLNEKENFNFKYSLIHGDFDRSNIIVNPKNFKIIGIVDFEESRIYDRAVDFLFYEEGDIFLNEILSNYEENIDENFEQRMKFLYGRSCLGYIEFGMENNLPDMVDAGFQLLRRRMNKFPI